MHIKYIIIMYIHVCYSIMYQLKNNMLYYVHVCNTVQTL